MSNYNKLSLKSFFYLKNDNFFVFKFYLCYFYFWSCCTVWELKSRSS